MFQILNCSTIGTCCSDYALANILDIIRRIFELIQLIAPIILILASVIQLTQMTMNPELKNGTKNLINKFVAAVIIFIAPIFVNTIIGLMPESFTISACWKEAKTIREISKETDHEYQSLNDIEPTPIIGSNKYEKGDPTDDNTTGSGEIKKVATSGVLSWPAPKSCNYITSTFGYRKAPTAGATSNHKGIDISCPQGSDVTAAYDGTVSARGDGTNSDGLNGGRGYYLNITHNINGKTITTQYYHLSQPIATVGSTVKQGQVIAKSGGAHNTPGAGYSTGSHLHFGVVDGDNVNPCEWLGLSKCSGDVSSDLK